MVLLTAHGVGKDFGADNILSNASLSLSSGERLAVVGPNGAGKTTLLRILAGELAPDAGTVRITPDCSLCYLPQDLQLNSQRSVWDEMLTVFESVFAMEARMRAIEHEMGDCHDTDPALYKRLADEYSKLSDLFEDKGGYSFKSSIEGVLLGLGIPRSMHSQPVNTLSGGQKSRVALAKILLEKADVLLMDEPTNHLDLDAITWLEGYLRGWKGALIIVSHDRWFLDAVCKQTSELALGRLTAYNGNYSSFLVQREARLQEQLKAYHLNQKEIARHQAIIERYHAFNREKSVRAARSWEKKLDKIERVDRPKDAPTIHFQLEAEHTSGRDVLVTDNLSMAFDENQLFSGLDLLVKAEDRIAIIGPNGIGKTTLLRVLIGELEPTAGSFLLGAGVEAGYYDQQQAGLTPNKTVLDEVWDAFPKLNSTQLRSALAAFLFRGDDVFKTVSVLSGGEKGRVALLKLILGKRNFLLLDEPTNHLDMDSRQVLEEALLDFPGTVLFVSHDRYFINRIATRILEMDTEGTRIYEGDWEDYVSHQQNPNFTPSSTAAQPPAANRTQEQKDRRKEREEKERVAATKARIADIEKNIAAAEEEIRAVEERLCDPASLNPDEIASASLLHTITRQRLDDLYWEWEAAQTHEGNESNLP